MTGTIWYFLSNVLYLFEHVTISLFFSVLGKKIKTWKENNFYAAWWYTNCTMPVYSHLTIHQLS